MPQNNKSELDDIIEGLEELLDKPEEKDNFIGPPLLFLAKAVQSDLAALREEVEEIRSVLPKKGKVE